MRIPHLQRYLITGLLTVFPIWLTWVVFQFVLQQLSRLGSPIVNAIARGLMWAAPGSERILNLEWLQFVLGVLLTLGFFYGLGWLASLVIGKRLLAGVDALINRIPLVQSLYSGTKKLLAVLQVKPKGTQRVVLIDFPHTEMKAVGFVTRVIKEEGSGRELAAVYVPTTPNPTSGYLEVVPVEKITPTNWTVDQAMAFIISGGAVSPDHIPFTPPAEKGEPVDSGQLRPERHETRTDNPNP